MTFEDCMPHWGMPRAKTQADLEAKVAHLPGAVPTDELPAFARGDRP